MATPSAIHRVPKPFRSTAATLISQGRYRLMRASPPPDPPNEAVRKLQREQVDHVLLNGPGASGKNRHTINSTGMKKDGRVMLRDMEQTWEQHMAGRLPEQASGAYRHPERSARSLAGDSAAEQELQSVSGLGVENTRMAIREEARPKASSLEPRSSRNQTARRRFGLHVVLRKPSSLERYLFTTKQIWSDASMFGHGGHLGPPDRPWAVWNQSHPTEEVRLRSRTGLMEAKAQLHSLRTFASHLRPNDRVHFYTDNSAVYRSLQTGWNKDRAFNDVILEFHRIRLELGVIVVPKLVSGKENTIADRLSKGRHPFGVWMEATSPSPEEIVAVAGRQRQWIEYDVSSLTIYGATAQMWRGTQELWTRLVRGK